MSETDRIFARFDALTALIGGYELSQIVMAFVDIGGAESLARRPATSDELAAELHVDPDALHRLLRALRSLRIVALDRHGRYELTHRGRRLTASAPDSVHGLAAGPAQPWWWAAWGRLADAVRTGRSGFEEAHGRHLYRFFETDARAAAAYVAYLAALDAAELNQVADTVDLSRAREVVDVGGGEGALLETLLRRNPNLRGTLLDVATPADAARSRLAAAGLGGRARVVTGDFFEGVPKGADIYFARSVLHDWDDEQAGTILKRIREAIPPSGELVVVQHALSEDERASRAAFIDIALLVLTGGRERTLEEYQELIEGAGFAVVREETLPTGTSLLVSRPTVRDDVTRDASSESSGR